MTTLLLALLLTGTVRDRGGEPLPGATVFVKGTQTSVVAGADGGFSIEVEKLPVTLVAFLGGFEAKEIEARADAPLDIRLQLVATETMTVTAQADRDAPMSTYTRRPLDIVRTPGAQGDVFRALQTLPGVAKADDGAGLFVRGGDVSETRVLLDGTTIAHPYRYETPSGGQAGSVEPFLLEGIAFSTGGFSARHGNALSAIVDLRGLGKPSSSATTVTAGLAGVSTRLAIPGDAERGFRVSGNLRFPRLLFAVNGAPREFDRYPSGWDFNVSAHYGALKVFAMEQRTSVGVEVQRDSFEGFLHAATRQDIVAASLRTYAGEWQVTSSLGADVYANRTNVGVLDIRNEDRRLSWRTDLARVFGATIVRMGVDADAAWHDLTGHTSIRGGDYDGVSGTLPLDVAHRDWHGGLYAEGERTWGRVTPTVGVRVDRSGHAGTWTDPRLNVTVALRKNEQLRFAWGIYHQAPATQYYERADALRPMRATHLVAGYEHGNPDSALHVRVEAYEKRYSDLPLEVGERFTSAGHGHARGIDLYAQRQWTALTVRATYSFVDARRRWTPYEQRQRYVIPDGTWRPDFWIPHSAGVVANWNPIASITISSGFYAASGRPVTPVTGTVVTERGLVPIYGEINSDQLPRFERFDLSSSYRRVRKSHSLIYILGISNVFARENAFEYAYSEDYSERRPVVSAAPRSVYAAISYTR